MKKIIISAIIIALLVIVIIVNINFNNEVEENIIESDSFRTEKSNGNTTMINENGVYTVIDKNGEKIYSETDPVQAEILYNDPEFDLKMPDF